MFTGIIRHIGTIDSRTEERDGSVVLRIQTELAAHVAEGDSIAVNGACLTVLDHNSDTWVARLMHETLQKTALGGVREGDSVNLEPALQGGQSIDGHFVQGHVDGTCEVTDIKSSGDDRIFTFKPPEALLAYLIPKGSVALNGVSLTVVDVFKTSFTVSMMPYTLEHTTFSDTQIGDMCNIEVDMIGKYVRSYMERMQ